MPRDRAGRQKEVNKASSAILHAATHANCAMAPREEKPMKYLLLLTRNPEAPQPTPDVFLKHKEWVQQEVKKGTMEVPYTFAGSYEGMCIINADTPEDLDDIMIAAPARPFANIEVKLLSDFAKSMDRVAAAMKRAG
jgi:muconolactone delta-isomerase